MICDPDFYSFTSPLFSGIIYKNIDDKELKNILVQIKDNVYENYVKPKDREFRYKREFLKGIEDIIFDKELTSKIKDFFGSSTNSLVMQEGIYINLFNDSNMVKYAALCDTETEQTFITRKVVDDLNLKEQNGEYTLKFSFIGVNIMKDIKVKVWGQDYISLGTDILNQDFQILGINIVGDCDIKYNDKFYIYKVLDLNHINYDYKSVLKYFTSCDVPSFCVKLLPESIFVFNINDNFKVLDIYEPIKEFFGEFSFDQNDYFIDVKKFKRYRKRKNMENKLIRILNKF